jgi:hypothetical protein
MSMYGPSSFDEGQDPTETSSGLVMMGYPSRKQRMTHCLKCHSRPSLNGISSFFLRGHSLSKAVEIGVVETTLNEMG